MTVALNEHRQDDDKRTRIQKAQRLSQLGRSEADIALAMGISVATAKRLVNSDAKTRPRKHRGPSKRPKASELIEFLSDGTRTEREREIVRWVLGNGARP
jgi:DNA-binding CsgD family transcriptional regulator